MISSRAEIVRKPANKHGRQQRRRPASKQENGRTSNRYTKKRANKIGHQNRLPKQANKQQTNKQPDTNISNHASNQQKVVFFLYYYFGVNSNVFKRYEADTDMQQKYK